MSTKNIRVLVVDDSALIREIITDNIEAAPGLEVAGTACDGRRALRILDEARPDVITLDVQMPGMNGLETLDVILDRDPVPVIMVSALTQMGANTTLEALDRGALDYVAKPEMGSQLDEALNVELIRKIRAMAGTDVRRMLRIRKERAERVRQRTLEQQQEAGQATQDASDPGYDLTDKCIALGVSTGGPPALSLMFESLQPPLPPMVIVQHMPPNFTKSFAWRLNSCSPLEIKEAATGDILQPNHVYLAPGGKHLHLRRAEGEVRVRVRDGDPVSGHRPSVDVMMNDAADIFGDRCLGIIMTGMGRDGSDGCGAIRDAGGYTMGQDEATSDVYGMNKVAHVEGNIDRQFSLDDVSVEIRRQVQRLWNPETATAR